MHYIVRFIVRIYVFSELYASAFGTIPDLSRGHYARCRIWYFCANRLYRGISVPIIQRPRSREIHRIGQARVNSTVLNREIASRL